MRAVRDRGLGHGIDSPGTMQQRWTVIGGGPVCILIRLVARAVGAEVDVVEPGTRAGAEGDR
ncbi:hypothetical protein AQJ58_26525 [Streptomyces sp. DSM 15324]|nr:hypothetical protein AQJ58_26525 [Streptomyces sp. DSM 15324]